MTISSFGMTTQSVRFGAVTRQHSTFLVKEADQETFWNTNGGGLTFLATGQELLDLRKAREESAEAFDALRDKLAHEANDAWWAYLDSHPRASNGGF